MCWRKCFGSALGSQLDSDIERVRFTSRDAGRMYVYVLYSISIYLSIYIYLFIDGDSFLSELTAYRLLLTHKTNSLFTSFHIQSWLLERVMR